jgi:hypothetical protein
MRRTHVVSVYSWVEGVDEDAYGKPRNGWVLIHTGVEINLQPLTRSVEQAAAGRQIDATFKAFGPSSLAFAPDQAIVVTEVLPAGRPYHGPTTFRIRQIGEKGGKWDTTLLMDDTTEQIVAPA